MRLRGFLRVRRQVQGRSIRSLLFGLALPVAVSAQIQPQTQLTFAELEILSARIGEVRTVTGEIFDTADPKEDKWLFRLANAIHIRTRPAVIERALLFKTGDLLSVAVIEETERLLRRNRYLYDVQILPLAYHDGVVDIEVRTRDTWSLDLGFSAGRAGGVNSSGIRLKEYNLLGSGTALSFGRSNNVDRTSNEFQFSSDRAFGTWTSLSYSSAQNSDGRRDSVSVARPFYALDTRWAAGISWSKDDRIDAQYNAGNIASEFRHRQKQADVFVGWSRGRVDGWVHRYTIGASLIEDSYTTEPGRIAPAELPTDDKLVSPYLRFEVVEDSYERRQNRNLMARPEFFAMGMAATAQFGWASTGLGSSLNALLYSGSISHGFEPAPDHTLIAAATISGQYTDGQVRRQRFGAETQYYIPQGRRWLFYAAASVDALTKPNPAETLSLGGDNGLRGYPLRYQSGTRRALITLEERVFTDAYVWRLFRIGGAAFFDVGRAWGGDQLNTNPGWLGNAGSGLRIVSVRAAFGNVLHLDVAVPLNATPDIKKVQLLVKTKTSF